MAFKFNPLTGKFDLVGSGGSSVPTGTPNTFAGFDGSGNLYTIPNWNIITNTGGANPDLAITPADTVSSEAHFFFDLNASILPTEDLVNLSYVGFRLYSDLGAPFNHAGYTGFDNTLNIFDSGNKGNVYGHITRLNLGDGTNTSSTSYSPLFSGSLNVAPQHTNENGIDLLNFGLDIDTDGKVEYFNGLSFNFTIDGTFVNGSNYIAMYGNFASAQTVGISAVGFSPQFSNDIQYVNGYQFNPQFVSGASLTQGIIGFQDGTSTASGVAIINHTSINIGPNFNAGSTIQQGYTGINVSPNMYATLDPTAGINLGFFGGNFESDMQFWNGIGISGNLQGTSTVTNGVQPLYITFNFNDTSSADYFTGIGVFGQVTSGASIDTYNAINVNPQIDGTISSSLTLAQFSISGSASIASVTGVNVNVSGITSVNQKTALTAEGGKFNAFSPVYTDVFTVGLATQGNFVGTDFKIAAGFPLSGGEFVFGQLFNTNFQLFDNVAADILGGLIGITANAFVGQISSAAGKTTDTINMAVTAGNAVAAPSDGGTISNFHLYRAIGILPSGGATFITNMYAFRADGLLSAMSPTNLWGISIEDANAENFFQKSLAIGTGTKKVSNNDIALEVGSTKAVRLGKLTTAQRNALTPVDGMMIFNTDTITMEYYDGTNWVAF